jgi:hypothetical protein
MTEQRQFPIPIASDADVAGFIARYGKPYDPETDNYDRTPFIADIREGKNDPIYNAHSYHTKVPPRAIMPYVLHYTEPGDIILDPFCGSGMTGVAALMCGNPPEDILQSVPGAKKGPRRAILNDLSPAACHIAYNYCTPVDLQALKAAFGRIKAAAKAELDWLYGTEHYEPAVGLYEPTKPDVASRLKNPPSTNPPDGLFSGVEHTWELLDRTEVERRIGAEALAKQPLPENVEQFVCIPATTQYTIWSDIYRCQGMVTIEEPTGRVNRKTNRPIVKKVRRPRGCGAEIILWDAAVDHATGKVHEQFSCPCCALKWKKVQLKRVATVPVATNYQYTGLVRKKVRKGISVGLAKIRNERPLTARELGHLQECEQKGVPYWFPPEPLDPKGPQYQRNALAARKVQTQADFYTVRNLRALARFWRDFVNEPASRLKAALLFIWTSIYHRCSRRTKWHRTRLGQAALSGQLYIPSLQVENNIQALLGAKLDQIIKGLTPLPTATEGAALRFSE